MDYDTIRDLAIRITDMLVDAGYVPDCTDTNDATEFEVQDSITEILAEQFNIQEEV